MDEEFTAELIEGWLDVVYGDDENAKSQRRSKVLKDREVVKFQATALRKQAAIARESAPPPELPVVSVDDKYLDDVPDFDGEENWGPDYVPEIKQRLGIITAVRRYGKPQERIRSHRKEGVKVRCPFPHHKDVHPSAWVNTEKNTWYCGACTVGGDVIDFFAAARHGMEPANFHRSPEFRAITEEMAEDLGIEVFTPLDTSNWESPLPDMEDEDDEDEDMERLEPDNPEDDPPIPDSAEASEPITVTEDDMLRGIAFDPDDLDPETGAVRVDTPSIDVDRLPIPEGTFLHSWLMEIRKSFPWVPEEYLLILGAQAIGLAAGHHVRSFSANMPLTASLLVALVGPSGYGKSTAAGFLRDLIHTSGPAVAFDPGTGRGIKDIAIPVSPEAMITNVRTLVEDPSNAAGPKQEVPTTGWLNYDELANFIGRSRRSGGDNFKSNMMAFHDFYKRHSEPEKVFNESGATVGDRKVHDSFLSVTFTTQTESLRNLAASGDLVSGFLNRIIPVFGHQAVRRDPFLDVPKGEYYKIRFEHVWKVCRTGSKVGEPYVLPFSDDAIDFYRQNPFFPRAHKLADEHPIYARLEHIAFRLALCFAINEHARDCTHSGTTLKDHKIEKQHLVLAVEVVEKLILPGFGAMMSAVLANDLKDWTDEFLTFVRNYFAKHGRWPLKTRVANARFNDRYPIGVQTQGRDYLIRSGRIAEVKLAKKTKAGNAHYVIPEGKFTKIESGKTYLEEDVYK